MCTVTPTSCLCGMCAGEPRRGYRHQPGPTRLHFTCLYHLGEWDVRGRARNSRNGRVFGTGEVMFGWSDRSLRRSSNLVSPETQQTIHRFVRGWKLVSHARLRVGMWIARVANFDTFNCVQFKQSIFRKRHLMLQHCAAITQGRLKCKTSSSNRLASKHVRIKKAAVC